MDIRKKISGILLYLFNFVIFSAENNRIEPACAGLLPTDILDQAIPKYGRLPKGVSVIYDTRSHAHAFQFSAANVDIKFPSSAIFSSCSYFPDEFSIFFVIKHSNVYNKKECVLNIGNANLTILSVQLTRKSIIFTYDSKKLRFRNFVLKDKQWHTVGFSVTASDVTMTTDCVTKRRKKLKRKWPSYIENGNSTFQVASCSPKSGVLSGLLKDLILVPGADAAVRACPPKIPRHTHFDNRLPAVPDIYQQGGSGPRWEDCTWMDVGNIAYDLHARSLKVCINGIWQHVTVNLQAPAPPRVEKSLDYLEFYQDVQTPGPAIDVNVFKIDGEGIFAVFASSRTGQRKRDVSVIYKWTDEKFVRFQKIDTDAAQCWESFRINNNFFLAVANYGETSDKPINSTIYKWHRRKKRFKEYQRIETWTARDFEFFVIGNDKFLAVANHAKGSNQQVDSVIYKWQPSTKTFQEFQRLSTIGAYDWTYFHVDEYHFLAVAQAFDGLSTLIDSRIYALQNNKFVLFQTMETNGATDWEYFTIGKSVFLVVANAYNFGPQNFENKQTYLTNSTIYRLDREKRIFEKFQTIPTHSAVDWEFFRVGDNSYLIVSNAQNGGDERERLTTIFRWQGVDKFALVHQMDTLPNTDWETFTYGNNLYFIYSNAKGRTSQVLKAKFINS